MMKKYILHIAQNYSFEILRPLQAEIMKRGGECVWFVASNNVDVAQFFPGEVFISKPHDIEGYDSCAVFSPGNNVPSFLRGVKVQVFHGLEWKKKGHFKIRDFFDLYCTQGPITTSKFISLSKKHQNFLVKETGWSKLDPLFSTAPFPLDTDKPVVLYAPTFSEKLTSAIECFDEIESLVKKGKYYWLIKFHPLMNKDIVKRYKKLSGIDFEVIEDFSILPLLKCANVMVSDTSSVIGEFMLLGKPVVTYRNSAPDLALLNITDPRQLAESIEVALSESDTLEEEIKNYNSQLHPYSDGLSSARILDAVDEMLSGAAAKKKRPLNLFRNFKIRKKFNYWKF